MNQEKVEIVVTTIFEPAWLDGYLSSLEEFGRKDQVRITIIIDRKTPESVSNAAAAAAAKGFLIDCPSLTEQESYLAKLGLAEDFIPWNTDNRRNIGFLRAFERGCDVLISIDDDNYCLPGCDFVGDHLAALRGEASNDELADGAAWLNICDRLQAQTRDQFYARGYPYAARTPESQVQKLVPITQKQPIAVNAGLWLDDPDVDAVSRLAQGPRVSAASDGGVVLADQVWSPVNTQNTALRREAMYAYYYVRMGFPIKGMKIDRYGDIISGYFVQKCAKHLGEAIRFGDPVAEHRRSPHNLFKDLYHELAGMVLIEDMLPWLQELKLEGNSFDEVYLSLASSLRQQAADFQGFVWDDGGRDFLLDTATAMETWVQVLRRFE